MTPLVSLEALPPVLDLPTAAGLLGVGRTAAYQLVREDQWPTPVIRVGRLIRVPTAPLLALLGVDPLKERDRNA
jgi:predicted DNA-binding transcriptional regulator AlpA